MGTLYSSSSKCSQTSLWRLDSAAVTLSRPAADKGAERPWEADWGHHSGKLRRLKGPSPRAPGAPAWAPRGTSDPGRSPLHSALGRRRPLLRSAPGSAPPGMPTPGPPRAPGSAPAASRSGTARADQQPTVGTRGAGAVGRPKPAVQAAVQCGRPGPGDPEAMRPGGSGGRLAGARAVRGAPQPRPQPGARAPARPASPCRHMAPLCALLSCLLFCTLCSADSQTPGACGSGAQRRVGSGVQAVRVALRVPESCPQGCTGWEQGGAYTQG